MSERPPRVVVVDDSAVSRGALSEALSEHGIDVVGRAMDGSFGLRLVLDLDPDVVTCDLEMPRMDGFTFLRVITQKAPVPVIVVTSDARPESALLALELGARDFVVKPEGSTVAIRNLSDTLARRIFALTEEHRRVKDYRPSVEFAVPEHIELAVLGASTGGPSAIRTIMTGMSTPKVPLLIAQHMPPRFTAAFAHRLEKLTGLDVTEAKDGEALRPGMVRIAPGGLHLGLGRSPDGQHLITLLHKPLAGELYCPSVDHLFRDAAEVAGAGCLAVVLTGMGRDGAEGAANIHEVGGTVWCEAESTAVIAGMPNAAAARARSSVRIPLDGIADALTRALARVP